MIRHDDDETGDCALSKKLLEAGYECCSTTTSVRELFSGLDKPIQERDIAVTLGCMARTYTNANGIGNGTLQVSKWNIENFVSVTKELVSATEMGCEDCFADTL